MGSKPPQSRMRDIRKRFLGGSNVDASGVDPWICQSWAESIQDGIPHDGPALPDEAIRCGKSLSSDSAYLLSCLKSIVGTSMKYDQNALDAFKIAFFVLAAVNEGMVVYGTAGNPDTLESLERIGLTTGTSCAKRHIGASVVSRALENKGIHWIVGNENYQAALTDYALCSTVIPKSSRSGVLHTDFALLYAIPLTHYGDVTKSMVEAFCSWAHKSMSANILPQVTIREQAFSAHLRRNELALIVINKYGKVIDVNSQCKELLGFDYARSCGQTIGSLVPELKGVPYRKAHSVIKYVASPGIEVRFDFHPTTLDNSFLGTAIYASKASKAKLQARAVMDTKAHYTFEEILGNNTEFVRAKEIAHRASATPSSVLLCGETGVGKELFAHAIHAQSTRSQGPFIVINCAALLDTMVESTLFGNVERVFSDRQETESIGKIEQASSGTIFFANIDQLPLRVQSPLANVLKTGRVARIGSTFERPVDIRVVASSTTDLEKEVGKGAFDADLYYQVSTISLEIPPLRERLDDLATLAKSHIAHLNRVTNKGITRVSSEAIRAMKDYPWPGNVRELQNILERSFALELGTSLTSSSLPDELFQTAHRPRTHAGDSSIRTYDELERQHIKDLMVKHHGNKSKVAAELGITRGTLYRRLEKITDWS